VTDAVSSEGGRDMTFEWTEHGNVRHLEEVSSMSREEEDVDVIFHASGRT
jgi:hypothetical protein